MTEPRRGGRRHTYKRHIPARKAWRYTLLSWNIRYHCGWSSACPGHDLHAGTRIPQP